MELKETVIETRNTLHRSFTKGNLPLHQDCSAVVNLALASLPSISAEPPEIAAKRSAFISSLCSLVQKELANA